MLVDTVMMMMEMLVKLMMMLMMEMLVKMLMKNISR